MMIIIIAQLFHIQLSTSANTKQFNSFISIFNSLCYLLSSLHSTKIFFYSSKKKFKENILHQRLDEDRWCVKWMTQMFALLTASPW